MSAPVCHIPPNTPPITQPGPRAIGTIPDPGPTIESLLATVRALKLAIEKMSGQARFDNGTDGFGRKPDPNKGSSQWFERSRVEEKVKVYQNNDPSTGNYVEIERINRLVMADRNTGQTWTWSRDR